MRERDSQVVRVRVFDFRSEGSGFEPQCLSAFLSKPSEPLPVYQRITSRVFNLDSRVQVEEVIPH